MTDELMQQVMDLKADIDAIRRTIDIAHDSDIPFLEEMLSQKRREMNGALIEWTERQEMNDDR